MAKQSTSANFPHPGFNKKRRPFGMKGRALDDTALEEVRYLITHHLPATLSLYGDSHNNTHGVSIEVSNINIAGAPRHDLLIEYLHLIQDKYHCISARHLRALAELTRLAEAEVYEVATFYHHFDVIKEEAAPAPITVRVCQSLSCSLQGGDKLLTALAAKVNGDWAGRVRAVAAPCMGHCDHAAVAAVGKSYCYDATVEKIEQKIQKGETEADRLSTITLAEFTASEMKGDWLLQQLRHLKEGKKYGETVMAGLMAANLRGLGGAGFPTAKKWQIVRGFPGPRLMAVNIDEGEPGTFKDYFYLKQNPYRFILGMLVAAELVGVEKIYIYLRDEYPDIYLLLQRALAETRAAGWFGAIGCELRRGAGAYICGEESAMLESIEGKRGLPRHRPPFVAQVGLFGRPTLVNNLETLYWVPEIILKGPDWWNSFGRHERRGLRSYSLSGRVKNPGVKLAPAGITVQELIDEYGGGMADGHGFKAYLPGGASGGILPATMANIPLDFDTLQPHGCFIGSAAVIILSDQDNLADAALNLIEFFKDESCGQCTPCRVGTEKAMTLMQQRRWHKDLLQELTSVMSDASICGLGQAAMNPVVSVMKHFPDDFESQS